MKKLLSLKKQKEKRMGKKENNQHTCMCVFRMYMNQHIHVEVPEREKFREGQEEYLKKS